MKRWRPLGENPQGKWRTADKWAAGVVGGLFLAGLVFLLLLSAKNYREQGVTYLVDIPKTRDNLSWTTSLDAELRDSLQNDPDAGVPCEPPTDEAFRGVVLSGRDIHGRVRDYRVFKDRYYIEYRGGAVRCVEDSAPWGPVSEQLWNRLPSALLDYLVREGALDPR